MANIVLMPQLGISEESALLSAWHVAKGDEVKEGDKLFTLETGKATFDVQAEQGGTVLDLLVEEGDEVLIQTPVCVIGQPGEQYDLPGKEAAAETPISKPETLALPEQAKHIEKPSQTEGDRIKISPRAKRLAEETGVSPAHVTPSGPYGRIIARDIERFIDEGGRQVTPEAAVSEMKVEAMPEAAATAAYVDEPLSRMRKIIAENMHASLTQMAQLTLHASFDATSLISYRNMMKDSGQEEFAKISYNDMILFAVAKTLPAFPELNAHLLGDTLRKFTSVNLAFACDTEKGLYVPVIANADSLNLLSLSKEAKALAAACRSGNIAPTKLSGGTFTVSNLGALGIEGFTPVINPPQTGILGVGALQTRVREENGMPTCYQVMPLSLTFDHRALDGAPAARFLKALSDNLANFQLLLAK
ncbi:MAG TPA: 2-oxo acid dehydrogenase subunit E2 [Clostridiales bacterium]|nr:2-oxo acid dehydrogenase subunit E2 [Clostridiales bacterium]